MILILEFDGLLFDQASAWYAAHVAAADSVGWSRLDPATFWRLTRTKGQQADVLPGARPQKVSDYGRQFQNLSESDAILEALAPHEGAAAALPPMGRLATLIAVTLGSNLEARRKLLVQAGFERWISRFEKLDPDPRRRPTELKLLARTQPRSLVVAASEVLVRSAESAGLVVAGVATGTATAGRLHQAGAGLVYQQLAELVESLGTGGRDLVKAGLLPPSLDA